MENINMNKNMTLDEMNDFIDTLFDGSGIRTYRVCEQDDSYYVETEFYSDLGENVIDTIWFDNLTPESLIKGLENFKENIRESREELLELYISEKPRGTEQFSAMQLVNDNEEIIKFWHDTIDQAVERYHQKAMPKSLDSLISRGKSRQVEQVKDDENSKTKTKTGNDYR